MTLKEQIAKLIEKMAVIVKAQQKLGYLESHEEDFNKFDVELLQGTYDPSFTFLWVITPNGTHLTRIGISPERNDWAKASIECGYNRLAIFLIKNGCVVQVTKDQAIAEVKKPLKWQVQSGVVTFCGERIGVFEKKFVLPDATCGHFNIRIEIEKSQFTRKNLLALQEIAVSACVRQAGSLFARINSTVVNGENIQIVEQRLNALNEAITEVQTHFELA